MPHPVIHLGIAVATGYIITGGARSGAEDWKIISLCALMQSLMDIDHILVASSGIRYLHNLMVSFNIPVFLFIVASMMPVSSKTIWLRKTSLIMAVVALGHLAADMWSGGLYYLLYPTSSTAFFIPDPSSASTILGIGLGTTELTLVLWGVVVILGRFFYESIELEKLENENRNKLISLLEGVEEKDDCPFSGSLETEYGWKTQNTTSSGQVFSSMPCRMSSSL